MENTFILTVRDKDEKSPDYQWGGGFIERKRREVYSAIYATSNLDNESKVVSVDYKWQGENPIAAVLLSHLVKWTNEELVDLKAGDLFRMGSYRLRVVGFENNGRVVFVMRELQLYVYEIADTQPSICILTIAQDENAAYLRALANTPTEHRQQSADLTIKITLPANTPQVAIIEAAQASGAVNNA